MGKTINVSDIVWDTDGEIQENMELPTETIILFSELLYEYESPDEVDIGEMEDRAVNYLSDRYGFCIESLIMKIDESSFLRRKDQ